MVDEKVEYGVSVERARQVVDEFLLPPEEREAIVAERMARENLQAAIGMGPPIIGLPEGVTI